MNAVPHVITTSSVATPDPVSAAIEAHLAARAALTAACVEADEAPDDGPEGTPALAVLDAASSAETAAWEALLATRPADADGLVRMLRYVAGAAPMEVLGDARDLGRNLAEAAEAALRPPAPSPALVAMVEEWRALAGRINAEGISDEEAEPLGDRSLVLQVAICNFPAASVADLLAKVPVFEDELRDATGGLVEGADPKDTLSGAAWLGLFRDFERLACTTAPAVAPEATAADPVLALIAAHRAAYAEWARASAVWTGLAPEASGFAEAQAAADTIGAREVAAYEALFSAEPATLAGALALAEYLTEAVKRVSADAEPTDGETALRTVTAALRRIVPARGAEISSAPDPALAAYAASRRAEAEMAAFQESETAWCEHERALCDAQNETRARAWATVPTTHAGRRALVDYARFQIKNFTSASGEIDNPEDLIGDILDAFAAAIDAERPAPVHPDADLIALALPFLAAWRDEGTADAQVSARPDDEGVQAAARAAYSRVRGLAEQIAASPAVTAEGIGIKALVLAYIASEGPAPGTPRPEPVGGPTYSDARLLWQIQTGAGRLLDGFAPAVLGRPSGPDLPAMSIGELADLHEACSQAGRHLIALGDRFGAGEERWRCGVFLDLEADRLGDVALDCVEELQGRTPATEDERADRVSVLASHAARSHAWADLAALALSEASAGRRA